MTVINNSTTTGGGESRPAQVEVELDIFSGLPNPSWVLTNDEAEQFRRQMAAMARTSATPLSGNLGYRGFIVDVTQGATTQRIQLQRGVAQISPGAVTVYVRDEARQLERWLLNTGKPHLKAELFRMVERELP